jgi:TonB family protein
VAAQQNVDWGPWLAKLKQRVEQNWIPGQTGASRLTVVNFDVGRNGELLNLRVNRTSGHAPTDEAALNAIQRAAPFDPLPTPYAGNVVSINFQFEVNVFGQLSVGGGRQ